MLMEVSDEPRTMQPEDKPPVRLPRSGGKFQTVLDNEGKLLMDSRLSEKGTGPGMRRKLMVFLYSILGGLLTAYAYAVTVEGRIVFGLLSSPAVFRVATVFGLCAGAIVSPLVLFCMKGKDLFVAMPVIIGAVAVLTAGLNLVPSAIPLGLPGSFLLTGAFLLWWRRFGQPER